MELKEYADAEMMMIEIAHRLAGDLENSLFRHDHVSLAVPGGTTPGPIFDVLCSTGLDWSRVHVMLTDERWVPEDHERSNTRLLRERLLTDRAAQASYVPLYLEARAPEERLAEIEAGIVPELPISVALLGMGADMHTASIFPGADRLDEALNGESPVVPIRAPGLPEPRVTLSARVLREALCRHIVIIGQEKREALERARTLRPEEAPVAAVLRGAIVHWAEN